MPSSPTERLARTDCGPGAVFVDPDAGTAGAINTFLDGAGTTGFGTPTAETLEILIDYAGLEDTERANYIMLVTDGQSTCDDPVPVVTDLRDEAPEIRTFVIGFGSGVDPNELNDMAQAGDDWTYDPQTNQLIFSGAACDLLTSGSASELVISCGCPIPEIN